MSDFPPIGDCATPADAGALQQMPGHLIRRLNQLSNAIFTEQMRAEGIDLTSVQYAALLTIGDHAGIDQAGLAAKIAFDRSTIGGVLRRLEEKALIRRQRDEDDRRARSLQITPAGREMLRRMQPMVDQVQGAILTRLSAAERLDLMRLMHKVMASE